MTGRYAYDRTGELIELEDDRIHRCDHGWLDVDTDRPKPCPICKPELIERLAQQRRRNWIG